MTDIGMRLKPDLIDTMFLVTFVLSGSDIACPICFSPQLGFRLSAQSTNMELVTWV